MNTLEMALHSGGIVVLSLDVLEASHAVRVLLRRIVHEEVFVLSSHFIWLSKESTVAK